MTIHFDHPALRLMGALTLAAFSTSDTAGQWTLADSSVADTRILAISHLGASGYIGLGGYFFTSQDAGGTWGSYLPTVSGLPMIGIWVDAHFPTAQSGMVVGALNFDNEYMIMGSEDMGLTWTPLYESNTGNYPRRLNAVHFPTASVGYAVGTNGRIVRTTNAGANWSNLPTSIGSEITSVHFFDSAKGVIAGNGLLMRTTSAGTSWATVLSVNGRHILDGAGNAVVACGPNTCHISEDGGVTWTTRPAPFAKATSMHAFSANEFIVVDDEAGKVYLTSSGGLYWEIAVLPPGAGPLSVDFLDADNGCLGGRLGDRSMILTTNTGPGPGIPVATIASNTSQSCGSSSCTLQLNGCDPDWAVSWYRDGEPIATGVTAQVTFTTSTFVTGIEAHVDNGAYTAVIPWNGGVEVLQPFTVTAGSDILLCAGNSGTLSVDAPPGSTVLWQPSTGLSSTTSLSPVVSGLAATQAYTATVTNGPCSSSDVQVVEQLPPIPPTDWSAIATSSTQGLYTFVDAFNGFLGEGNTIRTTADGGMTWTAHSVPTSGEWPETRFWMHDAFHGYMGQQYALYRTDDGWRTYDVIALQLIGGNYRYNPFGMNRDTVLLTCNSTTSSSDRMMRSIDGGYSWAAIDHSFFNLMDVVFPGGNVVVAGGGFGSTDPRLYRSTDAGLTWQNIAPPAGMGQVADLEVATDGTVYAASYGRIWRSGDMGLTWTVDWDATAPGTGNIAFVSFQGPDSGFAVIHGDIWQTVNGGACWQSMDAGLGAYNTCLSSVADEVTFVQAGASIFEGATLFRNHPPTPGLRFQLARDTVCAGNAPLVVNNSIGHSSFTWSIDGTSVSVEAQPQLPVLDPGDHTITLTGTSDQGTSSVTRPFFVQAFDVTPQLSLAEVPCWAGDTVHIAAASPMPVLGYKWYIRTATDSILQLGGGPVFTVYADPFPFSYMAVPFSLSGCLGNFSEAITISADNRMPYVYQPSDDDICTWGSPTSTWYSTGPWTPDADLYDYLWTISPASAGTMFPSGDSCLIVWADTYVGNVHLTCQGIDDCGAGPPSGVWFAVDTGNFITVQPVDITVDVGDDFSLSVQLSHPLPQQGDWFQNGNMVVHEANDHYYPEATLDLAGEYYWRGWVSDACGYLYSDTITVTVSTATGSGEGPEQQLAVWPDPFLESFNLRVPGSASGLTLLLQDAAGRTIHSEAIGAGASRTITVDLDGLATGAYVLTLTNADTRYRAHLLRAE